MIAMFGEEVIPFRFAGVEASHITYGHRFLSEGPIAVQSVDDYLQKLASQFVMVDPGERRVVIRRQIEKLAMENGGSAQLMKTCSKK